MINVDHYFRLIYHAPHRPLLLRQYLGLLTFSPSSAIPCWLSLLNNAGRYRHDEIATLRAPFRVSIVSLRRRVLHRRRCSWARCLYISRRSPYHFRRFHVNIISGRFRCREALADSRGTHAPTAFTATYIMTPLILSGYFISTFRASNIRHYYFTASTKFFYYLRL